MTSSATRKRSFAREGRPSTSSSPTPRSRRHIADATFPNAHHRARAHRMAFATTAVKATRAPTLASTRVQRRKPTIRCVRASANKVRGRRRRKRGRGLIYGGEGDDATTQRAMRWGVEWNEFLRARSRDGLGRVTDDAAPGRG